MAQKRQNNSRRRRARRGGDRGLTVVRQEVVDTWDCSTSGTEGYVCGNLVPVMPSAWTALREVVRRYDQYRVKEITINLTARLHDVRQTAIIWVSLPTADSIRFSQEWGGICRTALTAITHRLGDWGNVSLTYRPPGNRWMQSELTPNAGTPLMDVSAFDVGYGFFNSGSHVSTKLAEVHVKAVVEMRGRIGPADALSAWQSMPPASLSVSEETVRAEDGARAQAQS